MRVKNKIVEKLAGVVPDDLLPHLPRGFQTLADVAILDLKAELLPWKHQVAEAYLGLLPYIKSVYLKGGPVTGPYREPSEFEHLAGAERDVIVHKENGVKFKFDFTKIMWSKGNIRERRHLASLVRPGETVVDMFAGIGYFSLMIAVHAEPRQVIAIEWNSTAFDYLQENVVLNKVEGVVKPMYGDCDWICGLLAREGLQADRIIMGIIPAPKEQLYSALGLVSPDGTVVHYEGLSENRDISGLLDDVREAVDEYGHEMELLDHRFVKSYGPRVEHAVLDVLVRPGDVVDP
ncbi:MAG: class I SAM-dependent methyltransferase [Promethearchaeota archaeon]